MADLPLNDASQAFLSALLARLPQLSEFAAVEAIDRGTAGRLVMQVPSPTGDPERMIYVWMEEGAEPSVEFGPWHTHECVWDSGLLVDLISSIMEDRFVIFEEIGGYDGFSSVLDLRSPEALEDYFTERNSAERIRLKSWSGAMDREIAVSDL